MKYAFSSCSFRAKQPRDNGIWTHAQRNRLRKERSKRERAEEKQGWRGAIFVFPVSTKFPEPLIRAERWFGVRRIAGHIVERTDVTTKRRRPFGRLPVLYVLYLLLRKANHSTKKRRGVCFFMYALFVGAAPCERRLRFLPDRTSTSATSLFLLLL